MTKYDDNHLIEKKELSRTYRPL